MLQLQNVTLTHRKDLRVLIENLSCQVHAGDKVAIIGEEGNGKSALLKYIYGDQELATYVDMSGQLINDFGTVGYLPQFLAEEDLTREIYDFIFADLDLNSLDYQFLGRLTGQLGLTMDLLYSQQELATLSGGQKIKVQLLKILLSDPELLLLDEPSNDLDLKTLLWLEDFIQKTDKTVMFISHDMQFLSNTATAVIHLESLKHKSQAKVTVATMPYQTYVANRASQEEKQGQLAQQQDMADQKRMQELNRVKQKVHHQLSQAKDSSTGRLLAKKMKTLKSREKRYERERQDFATEPVKEDPIKMGWEAFKPLAASKSVLRLTDYELSVAGRVLVPKLNLTLSGQDKIGLVGDNGLGKSLLMRDIWEMVKEREDLQVNYMPQDYLADLDSQQSPLDYLSEQTTWSQSQVMTFLGSMQFLAEEMTRPMRDLSGGQRAKLLILGLIASQANFLLLDEPTRNLAPSSAMILTEKLAEFQGGFLLISHDRHVLSQTCDTIYELSPMGLKQVENL